MESEAAAVSTSYHLFKSFKGDKALIRLQDMAANFFFKSSRGKKPRSITPNLGEQVHDSSNEIIDDTPEQSFKRNVGSSKFISDDEESLEESYTVPTNKKYEESFAKHRQVILDSDLSEDDDPKDLHKDASNDSDSDDDVPLVQLKSSEGNLISSDSESEDADEEYDRFETFSSSSSDNLGKKVSMSESSEIPKPAGKY